MMWQQEMAEALAEAKASRKRGAVGQVIEGYRKMTGKSSQSLWRIARQHGYSPKRKKRSDAGECSLSEGQILWIASQIKCTAREVKGPITPVEKALMDAEDNGIVDKGTISPARLATILRERGLSAGDLKRPTPHSHMRSLYPNHVHEVDMSVCIQFYLRGKLHIMDERDFYKNKYANFTKVKRKLIRYVATDHYSGAIWFQYFYSGGERAEDLFEFLVSLWQPKHDKLPFRGVPEILLCDPGSAAAAKSMRGFIDAMGITIPKGLPHTPRRQGQVECAHNIVERWFESGLRMNPAMSIAELNENALDFCIWYNATKIHSRHRMTRTHCWLTITETQLRECPDTDLLREIFAQPRESRKVRNDYSISFKGETYDLRHIPELLPGRSHVDVSIRPFTSPEILVRFKDGEHLVRPVGTANGGFRADAAIIGEEFKAVPESATQRQGKLLDRIAYGDQNPKAKHAVPHSGIVVMGNKAEKVSGEFMPRKGTAHAVSARKEDFEGREISVLEALKRIRPLVGQISAEDNRAFRNRYGTSIPVAEVDRLTRDIRNGRTLAEALTETSDDAAVNA